MFTAVGEFKYVPELKVATSAFALVDPATVPPDELAVLAHTVEVPPVHVPLAACAAGRAARRMARGAS